MPVKRSSGITIGTPSIKGKVSKGRKVVLLARWASNGETAGHGFMGFEY